MLNNVTVEDIVQGECEIPPTLLTFLKYLIEGQCSNREGTAASNRRILSLAQDMIFTSTKGSIKPEKHLTLAMTMKNLTGSRKSLEILNRFGHCVSYSTAEELETELCYASCSKSKILPEGINRISNLNTSVAFDNYDRFVETLTGKTHFTIR